MSHRGLGGGRGHAVLAQVGAKGVAQGMYVNRATALVLVRPGRADPIVWTRGFQVRLSSGDARCGLNLG